MGDADVLFDVRNQFLLGNYQGCINEATNVHPRSDKDKVERDTYMYRSYIAQGNYQMVQDEVQATAAPSLQAIKLMATYMSDASNKELAMVTLKQWLSDGDSATNPHLLLVAGSIYLHEQLMEDAMRVLHQSNSLEALALMIQTYLKIGRMDLAEKELLNMRKQDEDATATQLATAWIYTMGGDKVQDGFYIFKELADKYGATNTLLNGLAVCSLHMKKYEQAEGFLLDAIEKNSKDADTLTNLITCYLQLRKSPEVINRYINQLKTANPHHAWVVALRDSEDSFERAATRFAL